MSEWGDLPSPRFEEQGSVGFFPSRPLYEFDLSANHRKEYADRFHNFFYSDLCSEESALNERISEEVSDRELKELLDHLKSILFHKECVRRI